MQVMLSCSKPGEMYAIEVESSNAGIPYADSFYIATHFCLTRGSHSGETLLAVYCQIKYRKSVWGFVKGSALIIHFFVFRLLLCSNSNASL